MRAPLCGVLAIAAGLLSTSAAPGASDAARQTPATTLWAHVLRPVTARTAPRLTAPPVTRVRPATPEGETNVLFVLESATDSSGRAWVRVRLAILPNSATGWVPQDALGAFHSVRTRLVINRRALRAVLWRGERVVFRAPVGTGSLAGPPPAASSTCAKS